jgi:acetyl-CoA acetyltransferase
VNGAAIVGVAESTLGVTDMSILDLQSEAILRALDDCGLGLQDVDGLATTGLASKFADGVVAEYLGIMPTWMDSTNIGGASFELFLARATRAIECGDANVVVISYGSNQRSMRTRGLVSAEASEAYLPLNQLEVPYGPLLPISAYALTAQRHMHEFGTKPEHLAEVAVAAREWARLNPVAYRYESGPLTVDDVLSSPMISSPLRSLDCCLVTDGGGAVVLTSRERAKGLRRTPVAVTGFGAVTTHRSVGQMPDLVSTGAAISSARAYEMAKIGPHEIDVFQVYDSFTITVLLTLEALGLCGRGESGEFVADGRIRPGGSLALNTSGGGLSYTHPGMLGIFLIIEAVRQLRGEAGKRQVSNPETALCHGTGGYFNTHATAILAVDR